METGGDADPLRQARRPAERQDDRGRLLPGDRGPARRAATPSSTPPPSRTRSCTSASTATPTSSTRSHWDEAGPENWDVLLRCPNCECYREGIFAQDTVERFDEELDRGADALGARLQAPDARQHGRGDRPLRRAPSRPTPSSPRTSRPLAAGSSRLRATSRRTAPPRRRPPGAAPARARRAARAGRAAPSPRHVLERLARAPRRARPVAAIRSQSRSASAGVAATDAQVELARARGSRSRARISGSVTVPSSRSVPRGLPVRSAGPDTSSTSSSSWKARPMPLAEARRARRPCSGSPPSSAPSRQAASNRLAVFSRQRSR